jgi:hypothetical protein
MMSSVGSVGGTPSGANPVGDTDLAAKAKEMEDEFAQQSMLQMQVEEKDSVNKAWASAGHDMAKAPLNQ